jgi:PAS domain S-box-containing protein
LSAKNNFNKPHTQDIETPEARLRKALQEYTNAKEKGDEASTAGWGVTLGKAYQATGKNLEAVNVLEESCSFFKKNMDLKQEATTLNLLGTLYRYIGSLTKSLSCHTQALKIFEHLGDSSSQASTYNKLGIVYRNLNDLEQARAQYLNGLKIASDDDLFTKAALNNSLGSLYWYQGDWKEAEKYYKKALKIHEQQHNVSGVYAGVLNNLGNTMRSQENFDLALDYYDKALQYCESQRRINLRAVILKNIGLTYLAQKLYKPAQRYIKQSLDIAIKSQLQRIILEDYRAQSNLYYQTGQFEKAYAALDKFLLEYKKKMKMQSENDMANLHSIHKLEMGFKEIELLKANRIKERMYYILAFLALASFAGLAWFSLYRLKVRSRRVVRTKDKELHLKELQINKLGHDFQDIQDRYRRIFEGAPDAIVIADHQTGEIVQANPQAEHLFLAEKGEVNGVSLYQILSYNVLAQINAQRIESVNPLCRGMETTLTDFEGQQIPIEVSIHELFFGERRFLQVIIRDLREKNTWSNSCFRVKKWKLSAIWPVELPMISTIS